LSPESGPSESVANQREVERRSGLAFDVGFVRRVLVGNLDARREFIERMKCVPRMLVVRNASSRFVLTDHEIEDLTQEILMTIWRKLDTYRGDAALETWVGSFCHRAFLNAAKIKIRNSSRTRIVDDPEVVSPEQHEIDRFERLYRALDEMNGENARIVRLKHFDQLTFEQIGERLRRATSTIKSCYYEAIERLRTRMRETDRGSA